MPSLRRIAATSGDKKRTTKRIWKLRIETQRQRRLVLGAVEALAKLLKHPDWWARDAAVTKILLPHGPIVQRLLFQRPSDPPSVRVLPPMDDLSDEQRDKIREVIRMVREHQGPRLFRRVRQKSLGQTEKPCKQW